MVANVLITLLVLVCCWFVVPVTARLIFRNYFEERLRHWKAMAGLEKGNWPDVGRKIN